MYLEKAKNIIEEYEKALESSKIANSNSIRKPDYRSRYDERAHLASLYELFKMYCRMAEITGEITEKAS